MEDSLIYGFFKKIGLLILANYEKSRIKAIGKSLSKEIINIRDNSIFISHFFTEKNYIESSSFFKAYKLILIFINRLLMVLNKLVGKFKPDSLFYLSGKELNEDVKNKEKWKFALKIIKDSLPYKFIKTIFQLEEVKKVGK